MSRFVDLFSSQEGNLYGGGVIALCHIICREIKFNFVKICHHPQVFAIQCIEINYP